MNENCVVKEKPEIIDSNKINRPTLVASNTHQLNGFVSGNTRCDRSPFGPIGLSFRPFTMDGYPLEIRDELARYVPPTPLMKKPRHAKLRNSSIKTFIMPAKKARGLPTKKKFFVSSWRPNEFSHSLGALSATNGAATSGSGANDYGYVDDNASRIMASATGITTSGIKHPAASVASEPKPNLSLLYERDPLVQMQSQKMFKKKQKKDPISGANAIEMATSSQGQLPPWMPLQKQSAQLWAHSWGTQAFHLSVALQQPAQFQARAQPQSWTLSLPLLEAPAPSELVAQRTAARPHAAQSQVLGAAPASALPSPQQHRPNVFQMQPPGVPAQNSELVHCEKCKCWLKVKNVKKHFRKHKKERKKLRQIEKRLNVMNADNAQNNDEAVGNWPIIDVKTTDTKKPTAGDASAHVIADAVINPASVVKASKRKKSKEVARLKETKPQAANTVVDPFAHLNVQYVDRSEIARARRLVAQCAEGARLYQKQFDADSTTYKRGALRKARRLLKRVELHKQRVSAISAEIREAARRKKSAVIKANSKNAIAKMKARSVEAASALNAPDAKTKTANLGLFTRGTMKRQALGALGTSQGISSGNNKKKTKNAHVVLTSIKAEINAEQSQSNVSVADRKRNAEAMTKSTGYKAAPNVIIKLE